MELAMVGLGRMGRNHCTVSPGSDYLELVKIKPIA